MLVELETWSKFILAFLAHLRYSICRMNERLPAEVRGRGDELVSNSGPVSRSFVSSTILNAALLRLHSHLGDGCHPLPFTEEPT